MNFQKLSTCKILASMLGIGLLSVLVLLISQRNPLISTAHAQQTGGEHADHVDSGRHNPTEDEHAEEGLAGHDEHEEGLVRLDEHQMKSLNIHPAPVRLGSLSQTLTLPGEVHWNEDRVVHITPRVPGIVREVHRTLGDRVTSGTPLTTLDSAEIGQARMNFLESIGQLELTEAEHARLVKIAQNTRRLMEILDGRPSSDAALEQTRNLHIGVYKTQLMGAYTRLQVAQRTWDREQELRRKKISSEADYTEAMGNFETARSNYQSLRESIDYELDLDLLRQRNEVQVARMRKLNAERTLHVLGLSDEHIGQLREQSGRMDDQISRVTLTAPLNSLIVERHLSRGEQVDQASALYKLADTSDVWFIGRAYERDLSRLQRGQRAEVRLDAYPGQSFEGVVDYLGSELDPESRTIGTRIVLPNPDGQLRAGLFGQVTIFTEGEGAGLLVPSSAVQRTAEGSAVYVIREPGVFEQVPVQVTDRGEAFSQVRGPLAAGDQLATGDTLILKTEAGRTALGGGHSH